MLFYQTRVNLRSIILYTRTWDTVVTLEISTCPESYEVLAAKSGNPKTVNY